MQSAAKDQKDITAIALDPFDRRSRHPPAAVDLCSVEPVQFGQGIAHPQQDQVTTQPGVDPQIVIFHFQSDKIGPQSGWQPVQQARAG